MKYPIGIHSHIVSLTLFPVLLAGALLVAACGGEETVMPEPTPEPKPETGQYAISFSSGLPEEEEVTRAVGLEDYEQSFKVWAYKVDGTDALQNVIPGFTVNWTANTAHSTTSNSSDWEYVGQAGQTIKYWDLNAESYRFFAMAPASAAPNHDQLSTTGTPPTAASFSFEADATSDATIDATPFYSELWYTADVLSACRQPVTLTFLKPFCRVRFMFTFVEGLIFGRESLSGISFKPATTGASIATKGDFTVTYPLTGSSTKESWSISNIDASIPAFTIDYYETPTPTVTPANNLPTTWPNSPEHWYTVLPATNQGNYILTVQVVTPDEKTVVIPAEYMSWQPGFEYTYKFKITEGGSVTLDVIQVGIDDWTGNKRKDHTVYNW